LGEGVFDYPYLMSVVQKVVGDNGWAVVEYENGEEDINRYTKARAFLKELGY